MKTSAFFFPYRRVWTVGEEGRDRDHIKYPDVLILVSELVWLNSRSVD